MKWSAEDTRKEVRVAWYREGGRVITKMLIVEMREDEAWE